MICAILIAITAKRLHFPYVIGLMAGGAALALLSIDLGIDFSADLVLLVLLPALIFEAAVTLDWSMARSALPAILAVAAISTLATLAIVAAGVVWLLDFPWAAALLFAAPIAATDPVAILAVFDEHEIPDRLRAIVQGESLINDGLAATIFILVLGWSHGAEVGGLEALWKLVRSVGGGLMCGVGGALLSAWLAGRTRDDLIEIAITILAAYGSYLAAHELGLSAILAALSAGILLCNIQPFRSISDAGLAAVTSFWRFAAFLANSTIFLLIGASEAQLVDITLLDEMVVAFLLTLAGRAVAIYGLGALFDRDGHHVEPAGRHVLVWGGLRGALPLALVLTLPADEPMRAELVSITFGVVAASLVSQALSLPLLLRRLRFAPAEGNVRTSHP